MLENVANAALVVLGISFLIFMHELGHFAAARLFRVRVETFSIGFGPRLFGRRVGDTDYRVSAIPLGGYVKMAGEYGDYSEDDDLDPDDLGAKPIWQRFVIFSGGVVVNLLLAFLIFPIAFGSGVPFMAPTVGGIVPGGPAWAAGLRIGDTFASIDGRRIYGFSDVALEVALGDPDGMVATINRGGTLQEVELRPRHDPDGGRYDIGIVPARSGRLDVTAGGPAAAAGLEGGERVVAVNGVTVGSRRDGHLVTAYEALQEPIAEGEPLEMVVERDGTEVTLTVEPVERAVPPDRQTWLIGSLALQNVVGGVRGPAAQPGFPLRPDDVVLRVDGRETLRQDDIVEACEQAGSEGLSVTLRRGEETLNAVLGPEDRAAVRDGHVVFTANLDTTRILVMPDGALADAGLQDGDTLVSLDGERLTDFRHLTRLVRADPDKVDFTLVFRRDGEERSVSVRARPMPRTELDYGLVLPVQEVVHEVSLLGALAAGWDASINALRTTFLTLTKLITGEVGTENLGGPIEISRITYRAAEWDFAKLLFFLALLSVNLGFINILPIPVLDGGQIVFLLCEKVKGSRLSERFMQNANLAGFVAILALMAYVTYNDILRS